MIKYLCANLHYIDNYNNICIAVCEQPCLHGGLCLSPGVCTCRNGYVGAACEKDLDECATGLHTCNASSYCVNLPGWYYCKCKPGYETRDGGCFDIDECYHNTHSCHSSAECVNTEGGFECHCSAEDPSCRLSTYNKRDFFFRLNINCKLFVSCRLYVRTVRDFKRRGRESGKSTVQVLHV